MANRFDAVQDYRDNLHLAFVSGCRWSHARWQTVIHRWHKLRVATDR
jgi:hypothetical protein